MSTMLLALAVGLAAISALLWYVVAMPGHSWRESLPPLDEDERILSEQLKAHVQAIASREHNMSHPSALESAAQYIEATLAGLGYRVERHLVDAPGSAVRNIEAALPGAALRDDIAIIGAHYDSVIGAPGANDNGSGVAAVLELARLLREWQPARSWRFVLFVNEEPPYFQSEAMGSRIYAERSKARGERIVAMYSLETIGWFSDQPGSQRYPFPLSFFYPDRGNFLAFVANLSSRPLLHDTIAQFRKHARFPSDGAAAPSFIPGIDWSDQWSFWREGWPGVMITDTAPYRYPYYHTAQDTPDKLDYDRLARVVRGLERTFRALDQSS